MTVGQINKHLDRLDKLDSAFNEMLVAAGRGNEGYQDILKGTGELSDRGRELFRQRQLFRGEIESRYGPNAPHRLPRGFGPIKLKVLAHVIDGHVHHYATQVDFAQVKTRLDTLEARGVGELRAVLVDARDRLEAKLRYNAKDLGAIVKDLALPGLPDLRDAVRDLLRRAWDAGGVDARREVRTGKRSYAYNPDQPRHPKGESEGGRWVEDVRARLAYLLSVPDFAKGFAKTLQKAAQTTEAHGIPFAAEWKVLSSEQRRELLARGWRIDVDRAGNPIIGRSGWVGPEILRLKVGLKHYAEWDESEHPREPAGSDKGGEFAPADVDGFFNPRDPVHQFLRDSILKKIREAGGEISANELPGGRDFVWALVDAGTLTEDQGYLSIAGEGGFKKAEQRDYADPFAPRAALTWLR